MAARVKGLLTILICLLVLPATIETSAARKSALITVSAGLVDRRESMVSFELPAEFKEASYALRDESGLVVPLQIDSQRQATFVLAALKAGASKTYRLVPARPNRRAQQVVALTRDKNHVNVKVAGRQVLRFVAEPTGLPDSTIKPVFLRGGYIHPVYTPSGRMVTDDYPSDHYHHHGIWFAWTKTQFEGGHPDFWNVGDGTGRVEFESLGESWGGPVQAGFRSRQRYVAVTSGAPKTALNEEWDVRVYNVGREGKRYFMFDIVATQQCASSSPLILDEYRYGGMGIRGHRDWKDKTRTHFLTSEGKTRADGNATRGRWCHFGGLVDGDKVGIAVLDHPANFRAPAPMRINPDDPFFNYAPSQLGKFDIKPGETFILRYRYIVSDGPADPTELDRLWADYAYPVQVNISEK